MKSESKKKNIGDPNEKSPPKSRKIRIKVTRNCETCFRKLENECHIQCTRCKGFTQCMECFALGIEKGTHLKEHPIIVMEPYTQNFFTEDWCLEEELKLLDSIEVCGIGNWVDISERMGKTKTKEECESHYYGAYIDVPNSPHPDMKLKHEFDLPSQDIYPIQESLPSMGDDKNLHNKLNQKDKKTNGAEYCGYMPMRGEFDTEFNNKAEMMINGIQFDDTDTEETLEKKLNVLLCYDTQLAERSSRRKVVIDWEIHMKNSSKLNETTKDINPIFLSLAPYYDRSQIQEMNNEVNDLHKYYNYIIQHRRWISGGVLTNEEGFLLDDLNKIINRPHKNDKELVDEWNERIKEYCSAINGKDDGAFMKQLMLKEEIDFCYANNLDNNLYQAMKDLIMREAALRNGNLSRNEAMELDTEHANLIGAMWDKFVSWHFF
ncbi:Myb-like DNA-binding domain containing protein [Histomonas meleagridis]|uniref:Myb-like DNA-binding domain containing protein n=1 Tax=Histomonas meleagridis TaxID=135588 RepID=UPI00355A5385|nr:Myb-like DNA-binding domain containing protein [Histomonas meleagridis]KAH0803262.1 Myb-like DNA-binding domain containing protein [Histomonas meleagridis]